MPCLTLTISDRGPVLDLTVGVSKPKREALIKAKTDVPPAVRVRGLIDTGASNTCVDFNVISKLDLNPTGLVSIGTPSTGDTPHNCNQFDVSINLLSPKLAYTFHSMPVIESHLSNQGIEALIGRDILAACLLVYNGNLGVYTLAF